MRVFVSKWSEQVKNGKLSEAIQVKRNRQTETQSETDKKTLLPPTPTS